MKLGLRSSFESPTPLHREELLGSLSTSVNHLAYESPPWNVFTYEVISIN